MDSTAPTKIGNGHIGMALAERLGLNFLRREGHDLVGPCVDCESSDAFHLHTEKGVGHCFSCGVNFSPFTLAEKLTGREVAKSLMVELGIFDPPHNGKANGAAVVDPIAEVAREKRCQRESLVAYGAKAEGGSVVLPVYGPHGEQCSTFTLKPRSTGKAAKGLLAKGKPSGLFLPHEAGEVRLPKPGETWCGVEGGKDSPALHGLGYLAFGMPTCHLSAKFIRLFASVHVVLVPDRDEAGTKGAEQTAAKLFGVAASVRIAALPAEYKQSHGADVRDVLHGSADGEQFIRQAIETAVTWEPAKLEADTTSKAPPVWEHEGRTDAANAARFVERYGGNIRWCGPHDCWYWFDGKRWLQDRMNRAEGLAFTLAAELWDAVRKAQQAKVDDKRLGAMMGWARASNGSSGIRSTLFAARSRLAVLPEVFDVDPYLFNCPNGTLDLRTCTLRPHDRGDYLTKLCPTNYNPEAPTYEWEKVLEKVFDGKQRVIDFWQRWCGYGLTGDVREDTILLASGTGANGKTTVVEAYKDTVGEYAMTAPRGFLLVQKNERHSTETFDLRGKRFVVVAETGEGGRLDEDLVKALTGREKVRARRLYADHEEFPPSHKLSIYTNHRPRVNGSDHAIWRRLALLEFPVRFWNPAKGETGPPELRQDKELPAKLAKEAEGILAWAVQGALAWQRSGLAMPEEVQLATAAYRADEDTLGRFLADCCVVDALYTTKASDLRKRYETWCEENGEFPLGGRRFGEQIAEKGIGKRVSNGTWYTGVGIIGTFQDA